jgi:hypothetical protein
MTLSDEYSVFLQPTITKLLAELQRKYDVVDKAPRLSGLADPRFGGVDAPVAHVLFSDLNYEV